MYDDPFEKIDNKNDPFYLEGEIVGHTNPFLFVKIGAFILSVILVIVLFTTMPKVVAKMSVPKHLEVKGVNMYEDVNVKTKMSFNTYKLEEDHYCTKYMYSTNSDTGQKMCFIRVKGTWTYDKETKQLVLTYNAYEQLEDYSWKYHILNTFSEHFKVVNNEKIVANETNYDYTFVKVDKFTY